LVSERVFPFLGIRARQLCMLGQGQALRQCALSSNNVYLQDTAVAMAILVHQPIFDDPRHHLILWLPFRTQGSAISLRIGSLYGREKLRYRVGCSRDGPEDSKRTYLQDLIQNDAQDIWEMLGPQRGILIISGPLGLRTKCLL